MVTFLVLLSAELYQARESTIVQQQYSCQGDTINYSVLSPVIQCCHHGGCGVGDVVIGVDMVWHGVTMFGMRHHCLRCFLPLVFDIVVERMVRCSDMQ